MKNLFVVIAMWLCMVGVCTAMDTGKSLRTPQFEGKQETFQVWWMRFKAYATVMQFAAALDDEAEDDPGAVAKDA